MVKKQYEFKEIERFCKNCGKNLILCNTPDIQRKKFCSISCHTKYKLNKGILKNSGRTQFKKNQTWEERFGEKKADMLKSKMKERTIKRNLENNPMDDLKIREEHSKFMKGRESSFKGKHHHENSKKKMRNNARWLNKGGIKHPAYIHGNGYEPYDKKFNEKLKRTIRKRDNQICMLCGVHREKLNRALSIHHINYDKQCNLPDNLISLCLKCHIKTNTNSDREIWTKHFQAVLNKRYNYQYSENQEIKLELKANG